MRKTLTYRINIFLFLLPALFLFVSVLIAPIAMSTYYSFFNWNGLKTPEFIGIKNYVEAVYQQVDQLHPRTEELAASGFSFGFHPIAVFAVACPEAFEAYSRRTLVYFDLFYARADFDGRYRSAVAENL